MTWKASRWKEVVILCGLALLARVSLGAECKNRIDTLGLGSAILRGEDLTTVEKLKEVMAKEKYQKAFKEILDKDELLDRWPEVLEKINGMTQDNLAPHHPGTQFEWMAYRRKKDRKISLLKNSCWTGKEDLQAWTFDLEVEGRKRTFIIPVQCLNLTLLKVIHTGPPSCTLDANVDCYKSQATITATASADEGAKITSVTLTSSSTNVKIDEPKKTTAPYSWIVDVPSGNHQFSATAEDDRGEKAVCTTKVAVCKKPEKIPPCKPPSCDLKVTGDWPKGADKGSLSITAGAGTADGIVVKLNGQELPPEEWKAPSKPGNYTVELTVQPSEEDRTKGCKEAKCSTTIHLAPPPPCCVSPWFLRASSAYADAQGSEVTGSLTNRDGKRGPFKFDFNQGLGFGLGLERLFISNGGPWDEANWGWTLDLLRINLDTVWLFDPEGRWIRDEDRVPMTALMTGVNYHIRRKPWDFFLGPRIGFVRFEDGTYADATVKPGTVKASFDDSFAFGASLGFDRFVGECWGLTGGVEYLKVSTEADFLDVDVDPLVVKAGFVYHF